MRESLSSALVVSSELLVSRHHSGVEIGGYEYSFNDSGIFRTRPHECARPRGETPASCTLIESIAIGVHRGSINELVGHVNALRDGPFRPGATRFEIPPLAFSPQGRGSHAFSLGNT